MKVSKNIRFPNLRLMSIILILTVALCSGCEKEKHTGNPADFLSQETVILDNLSGEWIWLNTHGGFSGGMITPQSESYFKTVVFTSQQNYFEIKDNHVILQTFYKIDSTDMDHYGTPFFKITYFDESKISQNMIIQQENDTSYLYLYDISNCSDCLSTSVYRKIK